MTEVLIIGASGLLGQHLLNEAEANRYSVTGTYCSEEVEGLERLDLTDFKAVSSLVRENRPDIVILPASLTSISECEANPKKAMILNSEAPLIVARACRSIGGRMVLISTVQVFDCKSGPYSEDSATNPVTVVGRTKLEGEKSVMETLPGSLVIRTCEGFGWNRLRQRENEVTSVLHRMRCGERLKLRTDRWRTLSYAPEVSKCVFYLIENGASGVFHIASNPRLTDLEMGMKICDAFGLDAERISAVAAGLGANNLRKECLTTSKIERILGTSMSSFDNCLAEMKHSP